MLDPLNRLAWTLDPASLMLDAGMVPDLWQAKLLRSRAPRILLNVHRQGGKSDTVAALAIGEALTHDGSLILLVSRTLRQADELYRKVYVFYDALGRPVDAVEDAAHVLSLSNGSRIASLPGSPDTLRGFSAPRLILVDEASRVNDEMDIALSPMLATVPDGRMILLSTPYGKRGYFYRAWEDTENTYERYRVAARECPRISREFLESERRRLGPKMYAQEYECSFEETVDQYFSTDAVNAAFDPALAPLFPGGLLP